MSEAGRADSWRADVVLADGGTVHVRPIRPDDAERLLALHGRLSAESIYYRFFSPKPRLTETEVTRFTTVDHDQREALVALLGDQMIGVARYDTWPGRPEAEVAFVVDDAHQGRGLATLLLEHLAAVARARGIERFTAEVLPDNRSMLAVFRKAGYEVRNEYDGGVVDVAFDITATAAVIEKVEVREQRAESRSIARLLAPRSVAVIGASARAGSIGGTVFRNLLERGFDGPVYPVNPNVPHVRGVRTVPSVLDVADDVHLAVIAVPASAIEEVIGQCARKAVRAVVVLSAEIEPGSHDERRLVDGVRRNGMRLVGPGSMGLVRAGREGTLHASFASAPVAPGPVAISSQSGPLGAAMLAEADRLGLGLSTFVSLGNKGDVSGNDLLQFWFDDPDTRVVCMYTESYGNPRKFARVARRLSRRKPIVAVKPNRPTEAAVALDALFEQAGVLRVDSVQELFDAARLLAHQPLPRGTQVAVVTNSRSPAVLATDALSAAGLEVAALPVDARDELARALPEGAHVDDPVDLTHTATAADYQLALAVVLGSATVDAVMVVHAPPLVVDTELVAGVIEAAAARYDKPVVSVMLGHDDRPLQPDHRVPLFPFPERAARALGLAARRARWLDQPEGDVPDLGIDVERAQAIVHARLAQGPYGGRLDVAQLSALLEAAGIPYAPAAVVGSADEAAAAATAVGFPVAVKALGLVRVARSESGGVALDLQDAGDVVAAFERMRASLGSAMDRVLVQRMAPGGVECAASILTDPIFGPLVTFGLGGAFADAIGDREARSLPLTDTDASALVAATRAAVALADAHADVPAVIDVCLRLAALADAVPELASVRLNPVLASPTGAVVVDAVVDVRLAPVPPVLGLRRLT